VTRLDRIEPELNEASPGDPRDTTAPAAMIADLATLLTGSVLGAESSRRLLTWLLASKTGDARLRAGVPNTWQVGDKTGSGERGTANDVGIIGRRSARRCWSRFISRSRRNPPSKEMPSLRPSVASLRRHCEARFVCSTRDFLPRRTILPSESNNSIWEHRALT
jgi:beta-lactamase class A